MFIPNLVGLLAAFDTLLHGDATKPRPFPKHQLFKLNDGRILPSPHFGVGSVQKFTNVTNLVASAFDAGYRTVDNAAFYRTEETAGEAIRIYQDKRLLRRDELFITTKFDGMQGQDARVELETSLSKLGLSYVDLYLVHFPFLVKDIRCLWPQMEALVESGLARSIGTSNYGVEELEDLLSFAKIKPAVNQIRYHAYNAKQNAPLLALCNKHDIVVQAYSSLTPITTSAGGPAEAVALRVASRLSATLGRPVTIAQSILGWINSRGIVAVTTSANSTRQREQLEAFGDDFPRWTAEEMAEFESFPGWNGTTFD